MFPRRRGRCPIPFLTKNFFKQKLNLESLANPTIFDCGYF